MFLYVTCWLISGYLEVWMFWFSCEDLYCSSVCLSVHQSSITAPVCTLCLQLAAVLMCVFLSLQGLFEPAVPSVDLLTSQSGGRLYWSLLFYSLRSLLSRVVWAFLAASASLWSGCVWFGLVRLKRVDGAVRFLFFSGCWLESLVDCGRSLFAAGLNGVRSCLVKAVLKTSVLFKLEIHKLSELFWQLFWTSVAIYLCFLFLFNPSD